MYYESKDMNWEWTHSPFLICWLTPISLLLGLQPESHAYDFVDVGVSHFQHNSVWVLKTVHYVLRPAFTSLRRVRYHFAEEGGDRGSRRKKNAAEDGMKREGVGVITCD